MTGLPPADRKYIYTKRSMYAGTHFTDPGRMESWVNYNGEEGHPNIWPSTRPGIEPGTSRLGGRDLSHCASPSVIMKLPPMKQPFLVLHEVVSKPDWIGSKFFTIGVNSCSKCSSAAIINHWKRCVYSFRPRPYYTVFKRKRYSFVPFSKRFASTRIVSVPFSHVHTTTRIRIENAFKLTFSYILSPFFLHYFSCDK